MFHLQSARWFARWSCMESWKLWINRKTPFPKAMGWELKARIDVRIKWTKFSVWGRVNHPSIMRWNNIFFGMIDSNGMFEGIWIFCANACYWICKIERSYLLKWLFCVPKLQTNICTAFEMATEAEGVGSRQADFLNVFNLLDSGEMWIVKEGTSLIFSFTLRTEVTDIVVGLIEALQNSGQSITTWNAGRWVEMGV